MKITLRGRNWELLLLLAAGLLLALGARYAAMQHIGGRAGPGPDAPGAVNVLLCSPQELHDVLARRLSDPELSRAQEGILAWRKTLSPEERSQAILSDIAHLTSGGIQNGAAGTSLPAPLLTPETYHSLRSYWTVRDEETARKDWHFHVGLLLACFCVTHFILRLSACRGTQLLLPPALVLCGVSAILLFTFTDPLRDRLLYPPFVYGVALGCAALLVAARLARLGSLESYKYVMILAASALSLLLIFLGTGPAGSDAKINLFGFFQPVEFIKLLVVLFLASYFAGKDVELRRLDAYRWMGVALPRWRDILPVAAFLAATIALFFRQKDLGPALIVYLVFLCMFIMASRRVLLGLAGLALLIAAFWASYRFQILQTVSTRIEMWLSPWDNHRPGGVQLAESLWALASGAFSGAGLGRGAPQYIPAGHTDLILAAAGEALGFPGLAAILIILGLVFCAALYAAWSARTTYAAYLGFCLALLLGIQTAIIAAGTVGLIPLTGVPLPFMSYGKSALVAHFFLLGLLLNLSATGDAPTAARRKTPRVVLVLPALVLACLAAVMGRAFQVMYLQADEILCRGALTPQADGVRRFSYNRRILDLAAGITRGSILDRAGFPLATNRGAELQNSAEELRSLGFTISRPAVDRRYYVLGPAAVQLLGHTGAYWTDPKTVERSADVRLRGYPASQEVILVEGRKVVKRDYAALVPAFRDRFRTAGGRLAELLARPKDVRLTLDARMQWAALQALEANLPVIGGVRRSKGAAVVLDAATGAILAGVSIPGYDPNALGEIDLEKVYGADNKAAYDRARFEIYPPGSTFKVVVAAAALEGGWLGLPDSRRTYVCRHENVIPWKYQGGEHLRHVTDDEAESAHGSLGLPRALVESCNVYFAWLGTQLGPQRLFEFAHDRFRLELKGVASAAGLEANLPDNAYGQAKITVSPLRMAAVAAAIVNGGRAVEPFLFLEPGPDNARSGRILEEANAALLRDWMVEVVKRGTGRRAAVPGLVVGGKTGTAQNEIGDRNSHSWFIGFAYPGNQGPERALAFAFLIENGGYGGRAAAQAAHDFFLARSAAKPKPAAQESR
jgi:cell division protein FtsW (lipid II flippase)